MMPMRQYLAETLADPFFSEVLFDALPDVVFFVKDLEGRYVLVNQTMLARSGLSKKSQLLGKTVDEIFAARFAIQYRQQDLAVLQEGRVIHEQLELHLYPNHAAGWCLTNKIPLLAKDGTVLGLAGISRDLHAPEASSPAYQKICKLVEYIHQNFHDEVRVPELARIAQMSVSQIERYFLKVYQLSPRQMLQQARLNAACQMLSSQQSITEIAASCGYQDHSAFARQFKATLGMTPSQYRQTLHEQAPKNRPARNASE